jgi:hypothetical protein
MSDTLWRNLVQSITSATAAFPFQRVALSGAVIDSQSVSQVPNLVTFDNVTVVSPITPLAAAGLWLRLTLSVNAIYTLNVPAAGTVAPGSVFYVTVRNAIGGAAGAMTFAAGYKLGAAWTQPANGTSRTILFMFDGTNYVEIGRTAADVAN